jgi:glyoxylase-like metal-dependent hydrolase (beta-lactamase superfamily II)
MAFLSRFFPSRTVNISTVLKELPASHEVPGLPGWTWLDVPGHAPGQVCFWQESGRIAIAGDALATVNLDSWRALMAWKPEISRPPSPFNYNWELARQSVLTIASLKPAILACGHGDPMSGDTLPASLEAFAASFEAPKNGRYATEPAHTNEHGVFYEPPAPKDNLPKIAAGVAASVFVLAGVLYSRRKKQE